MRFVSDVSRHWGNAAFAMAMASSIVVVEAKSTRFVTTPVAGSKTSPARSAVPVQKLPLIQWVTRVVIWVFLQVAWWGARPVNHAQGPHGSPSNLARLPVAP